MTEIRFYHMERSTLESTLPSLLGKAFSMGKKIIVKTPNTQSAEHINTLLWTQNPNSFLPHGTAKDGNAEHQPIWITENDENPNGADTLILTGGVEHEKMEDFTLCCEMLNGNNPDEITAARARWKIYKDKGFEITYWQQSQEGRWENKTA